MGCDAEREREREKKKEKCFHLVRDLHNCGTVYSLKEIV
jgi:hypothetical protein